MVVDEHHAGVGAVVRGGQVQQPGRRAYGGRGVLRRHGVTDRGRAVAQHALEPGPAVRAVGECAGDQQAGSLAGAADEAVAQRGRDEVEVGAAAQHDRPHGLGQRPAAAQYLRDQPGDLGVGAVLQ
ncbi:hypothetical protein PQR15_05755 [Streptomyces lydicus]|nr:hypothetical protein [Streptomyces lydicus]